MTSPRMAELSKIDPCDSCIWQMRGPWVKNRGQSTQELWCGADRDNFNVNAHACVLRTPVIAIEYDFGEHDWVPTASMSDTEAGAAVEETRQWVRENVPLTRFWHFWSSEVVLLEFVSERDAVMFRMRWG